MARVLIGYSCCGLTLEAFERHGHEVWTCDKLPARHNKNHIQGDIWHALRQDWDLAVLHPMCTYMNLASVWALKDPDYSKYPGVGYHQRVKSGTLTGQARRAARDTDTENFKRLLELPFPVAIENPAPSQLNTLVRPPDQVVHPYQFGDDASKGTGFWLTKGLPLLEVLPFAQQAHGRGVEWPAGSGKMRVRWANQTDAGQNRLSPGETRWLDRSKTYPGIAAAMGDQWGRWLNEKQQGESK